MAAPYKTLEQQIDELWASRGMRVIEKRVRVARPLKLGAFEWTIVAEERKA